VKPGLLHVRVRERIKENNVRKKDSKIDENEYNKSRTKQKSENKQ